MRHRVGTNASTSVKKGKVKEERTTQRVPKVVKNVRLVRSVRRRECMSLREIKIRWIDIARTRSNHPRSRVGQGETRNEASPTKAERERGKR